MNPAVTQSLSMAKHLRNRNPEDPAWIQALDRYFLSAAFEDRGTDPFMVGSDSLVYFIFRSARSYEVDFLDFPGALNRAIQRAAGGVVYPGGGLPEWVYSPGDMVSLAMHRTSAFQWSGDWGLEPILEDYSAGHTVNVGRPTFEFISPLAARALEFILRKVYQTEPKLKDRVPGITLLRPECRTRPEQASEFMVNAFREDFSSVERAEGFPQLIRRFVPSHVGRRLISFETRLVPEEQFAPLAELIEEGGLEPVPERYSSQ